MTGKQAQSSSQHYHPSAAPSEETPVYSGTMRVFGPEFENMVYASRNPDHLKAIIAELTGCQPDEVILLLSEDDEDYLDIYVPSLDTPGAFDLVVFSL